MVKPGLECVPSVYRPGSEGGGGVREHLPPETVTEENISDCAVKSRSSR